VAAEGIVNKVMTDWSAILSMANDIDTEFPDLPLMNLVLLLAVTSASIDEPTVGVTKVIANQTLELDGPRLIVQIPQGLLVVLS
jgi:hypothetical protein